MFNQTPEEQANALWVLAKIASSRDVPLIAALARKMDWETERDQLKLDTREFALLMLCQIPTDEYQLGKIAHYIPMNAADLGVFLTRAARMIAPAQQAQEPEESAPSGRKRRRQNRSDN